MQTTIMTRTGTRSLDQLVAVFVLLGLLLPARLLFACDLMDGKTFNQCCCEDDNMAGCAMGGGCGLDDAPGVAGDQGNDMCCAVSIGQPPSYDSAGSGHGSPGLGSLFEPAQPPPVLPTEPFLKPSLPVAISGDHLLAASSPLPGTTVLRLTRRLRI